MMLLGCQLYYVHSVTLIMSACLVAAQYSRGGFVYSYEKYYPMIIDYYGAAHSNRTTLAVRVFRYWYIIHMTPMKR